MAPVTIPETELRRYAAAIVAALGATPEAAAVTADSLVSADLAGHHSHGVGLLPRWAELIAGGDIDPTARPAIADDRGAVVHVAGHRALGPIVGTMAAELAIERARANSIAAVLVRDSGHLGRLAGYTDRLIAARCAAIAFSNCQGAGAFVAPTGAAEARLSSNSLALAMPDGGSGVTCDLALLSMGFGKIAEFAQHGKRLPWPVVVDRDGAATDDPQALADGGSVLPLGGAAAGHKGVGLLMLVELLAGVLPGGGVSGGPYHGFQNGLTLIAIDTATRSPDEADGLVDQFRRHVKSARRLPGVDEVLLPGERAARTTAARLTSGVPLSPATLRQVVDTGRAAGVDPQAFGLATEEATR